MFWYNQSSPDHNLKATGEMMEKIKTLIFWVVLGAAGYFAYQYFIGSSRQLSTTAEPTFNIYSLPVQCQSAAKSLEESVDQKAISANINGYTKGLRKCLRSAGLSNAEIDEAIDSIKAGR